MITPIDIYNQLLANNKKYIDHIHELLSCPDNKTHMIVPGDNEFVFNYLQCLKDGTLPKFLDNSYSHAKDFAKPNKIYIIKSYGLSAQFFTDEYIERCANNVINHAAIEMYSTNKSYCYIDRITLQKYCTEFEYLVNVLELSEFKITEDNRSLTICCNKQ